MFVAHKLHGLAIGLGSFQGDSPMAKKKAAKKTSSKKKTGRRKAARRELIDTGRDKRFVRRDRKGRFNESDDVGRSLSQDRRRTAKTTVKAGQGDRGDRKR
jgi:hypothetical protein